MEKDDTTPSYDTAKAASRIARFRREHDRPDPSVVTRAGRALMAALAGFVDGTREDIKAEGEPGHEVVVFTALRGTVRVKYEKGLFEIHGPGVRNIDHLHYDPVNRRFEGPKGSSEKPSDEPTFRSALDVIVEQVFQALRDVAAGKNLTDPAGTEETAAG